MNVLNGIAHFFGLDNGSGYFYLFWSGVGIAPLAWAGLAFAYWRHHNCHVKRCWWMSWKQVPGTDHVVCRRHHPSDAPTAQQVLDEHHAAQG